MGDFFAPKRRDVVDRLRRRIEQYRHRHINYLGRLNVGRLGLHEQQKHETELLHQRWLENKARKAKQSSKASKDSGGGGGNTNSSSQSEHRNLVTKLKQKVDTTTTNNESNAATNATDNIFQFDDNNDHHHHQPPPPPPPTALNGSQSGSQTTGVTSSQHVSGVASNVSSSTNVGVTGGGTDGTLPHLSVQIVQQISSQRQSPQTIHTNVTVSSTRYPPPPQVNNLNPAQPDNSSPSNSSNNNHPHHHQASGPSAGGSNINVHTSTSTHQHPHGGPSVCANTTTTTATLNNCNGNRPRESTLPGSTNVSTETSVHTSIECKQEPIDDVQCEVSQVLADSVNTSVNAGSVPDLPYDEIQYFLESIEKGRGDLIKELDDFDKIYHKVQTRAENSGDPSVFSPLDGCDSPGLTKATANFTDQVSPHQHHPGGPPLTPTMFEAPQAMGGMVGAGMPLGHGPPSLVEPTGPAAETLKQMAAQHQQTSGGGAPSFPGKGLADSHYPDPYDPFGRSRNGYPSAYGGQCYPPGGYPGYAQAGYGDPASPMGPYSGGKPDLSGMGYSQTKPLTHYPTDAHGMPGGAHGGQPSGPSSLQQLQNQVASHFSPMHITQTQQVRLAQGHRHLHLSQSQQVQMAAAAAAAAQQQQLQQQGPPQGMTVSQQQSFTMGGGPPPPHMQGQNPQGQPPGMTMSAAAAREMQMMQEKMRREQQQQQQQYMNRPPPEYKLHPSARSAGPPYQPPNSAGGGGGPHSNSGGSTTPLQTMQNMVNQTPPYPTTIKGEGGTGSVMTHQMSTVQSMAASVSTTGPHMGATMTQSSQSMAFQQQQQQQQNVPQRPPSYSPNTTCTTPNGIVTTTNSSSGGGGGGTAVGISSAAAVSHPHPNTTPSSVTSSSSVSSSSISQVAPSSNYTSALMRNQRPPNVNVGPEGLNISQPRAHPAHHHPSHPHLPPHMHAHPHGGAGDGGWLPRSPMMQAGGGAMSSGMGQSPALLPPGYSHRPGSAGSGMGGGGGGPMHPGMMGQAGMGASQVMMHQSMQMSQQQQQSMGMRGGAGGGHPPQSALPSHSAPYSAMMGPGSMQAQANSGTPPTQQYPPGLAQDDFMQFFNSEQSHNFDSLSSDLFDDILK